MLGFNPRDLRRMMKRMGLEVEQVSATLVSVELDDGSRLEVREPQVFIIKAKGQQPMMYVMGSMVRIEPQASESEEISEEDVRLVAEQAGVSLEEARRALEETKGDIAEAILRLQEKRG
ncbi:MAG: nascent polypeptide-associated complex protein [Desulfurococcales archaeon]|nr:nascent polypeptide-associated complex protein [Desulfurococcales archaeon]